MNQTYKKIGYLKEKRLFNKMDHLNKLLEQIDELDIPEGKYIEICNTIQKIAKSTGNPSMLSDEDKQNIINSSIETEFGLNYLTLCTYLHQSNILINEWVEKYIYRCKCSGNFIDKKNIPRHNNTKKHLEFVKECPGVNPKVKYLTPLDICLLLNKE